MSKAQAIVQERRRAVELAAQTRCAAAPISSPRLLGPLKGGPLDDKNVDWSDCPLAKAYPHWDEYVSDIECVPA